MAVPDIPAAKRNGLLVDLDRLTAEGDGWLTPEDRYALKTRGVCTQLQDGVFMVRVRIPGGVLPTPQARALARASRRFGPDWLHLTTRQNLELHWIEAGQVRDLLDTIEEAELSTDSACGHTLRNVMCSEEAGVALDEPFDCMPDARSASDAILARSRELNVVLPSRINMAFGGSPRCREDARIQDAAFVSVVVDGRPGYELWAGGSLGKAPRLAIRLTPFLPREDALTAAEALIDVFCTHGDLEHPARGRMKFVVDALGEVGFRAAWERAMESARRRPQTSPSRSPVEVLPEASLTAALAMRPPGGWTAGVRPQRTPGRVTVVVDIPVGDTKGSELELLADLADRHGDGHLVLSRDQDVVLRNVGRAAVPTIRSALGERGLHLVGEAHVARVRACTGSAVCALGISGAPDTAWELVQSPALGRSSSLRVHVSGCPNSCAQHQAGDIGLAGTKVRLGGEVRTGYHLFLGADLAEGRLGEVVGRVAAEDVHATVESVIGAWEATRRAGETLSATVRRLGVDAFAAHLEAQMTERWATGPEPDVAPAALGRTLVG